MGGGSMLTGNSTSFTAAKPPFSGTTTTFGGLTSPAAFCSGTQPCPQHIENCIFGSVPSRAEVERAIFDLQRLLNGLSTSKSELGGLQHLLHHHESKMAQAPGFVKFRDAFSMMQKEPCIQNMVISISCDEAVWEAILSNKAVKDLRGSISAVEEEKKVLINHNEEPDIAILVLRWIMGFTKSSKILELIEKLRLLLNDIFRHDPKDKTASDIPNLLEEKVRSSFLLSVIIILVVVVTRNHG